MIIFITEICPYTEYVALKKDDKSFYIVICEDRLFLPSSLCYIDRKNIMECINIFVSLLIFVIIFVTKTCPYT